MKVINLNIINNSYIKYKPLFKIKNYIYVVKQNFEESFIASKEGKCTIYYDGLYKYNLIDNSLTTIRTSSEIMYYFYYDDHSNLYYISIEEKNEEYYANFFKLDICTELEEKLFNIKLQNYIKSDYSSDMVLKINTHDITSKFEPFGLNEEFIGYVVDKMKDLETGFYNQLDNNNEFTLFIHDIKENRSYQILDEEFCKHGFLNKILFKFNNKQYILFNAALYEEQDKYEYLYNHNPDKKDTDYVRGFKDAIYIIPVETLINEVKNGEKLISYKEIDSIGQEGTIRFIHIYNSRLYYKEKYFDKDFSELVIYDMKSSKYERKKFNKYYRLLSITLDGQIGYFYDEKNRCLIELSGYNWEEIRKIKISGRILGLIESNYVICEDMEIKEDNICTYCNIYDMNSLNLVDRIEGTPTILGENTIVIC